MKILTEDLVKLYEKDLLQLLKENAMYPDTLFTSHMWLCSSRQKRAIYHIIYGEYLYSNVPVNMLDVGGGYSSLSKLLAQNVDRYELIEPFHNEYYRGVYIPDGYVVSNDWYKHSPSEYDIVIANGVFPDKDQRLESFLDKYLKVSHKIVLSLTFYKDTKFIYTHNEEDGEKLCVIVYTRDQIEKILRKFESNIIDLDFSVLRPTEYSIFADGRYVCLVALEGDI